MKENELATIAVDISFKIHQALGPGLLESVYESAFAYELDKRMIPFTKKEQIDIVYEGVVLEKKFQS